uniref:Formate dehydrogenase accessory protein n=1 Tax=Geobacter sp. (strain M21) TaxID=443144 RepID=C6E0Q3_GEOSM
MYSTETKIEALRNAVHRAPEYAAIAPFFAAVYHYLLQHEGGTGIGVDLAGVDQEQRSSSGFPLISPSELRVDRLALITFLTGLVTVLEAESTDGAAALRSIGEALHSGELDPEPMLAAILERRRAPLDEASLALGVPGPLLEYILEIPLKAALEPCAAVLGAGAFPGWQESVCPVCGARPAMAELAGDEGERRLCCSTCSYSWSFRRIKCPSCGCEDPEQLSYFTAGEGATRVDTCRACSRYIKTRDNRKGGGEVPLEVEDLLTIHLDLLASREGFVRGK